MSPPVICISTIAERYYRRDYQPINAFVTNRRRSRHAAAKKGVERQKSTGFLVGFLVVARQVRRSPISRFTSGRSCVPAVQVNIRPGLIAAFLIMTLMSDAYRVSGGPRLDSPGPSSAQLGALPIRLKANRVSLPTVLLSLSLFPSPFPSVNLC